MQITESGIYLCYLVDFHYTNPPEKFEPNDLDDLIEIKLEINKYGQIIFYEILTSDDEYYDDFIGHYYDYNKKLEIYESLEYIGKGTNGNKFNFYLKVLKKI
jgi:hypothetical protein